jgi:hypothetical protein
MKMMRGLPEKEDCSEGAFTSSSKKIFNLLGEELLRDAGDINARLLITDGPTTVRVMGVCCEVMGDPLDSFSSSHDGRDV